MVPDQRKHPMKRSFGKIGGTVAIVLALAGLAISIFGANAQDRKPSSQNSGQGLQFERLGF